MPYGPPEYVRECYPKNCFTVDKEVVSPKHHSSRYKKFLGVHSLSFGGGDGDGDASAEPPVFNGFQYCVKQEEKEIREFLAEQKATGTVKSVNSVSPGDPYGGASPRPSFSSGRTLRAITANLRNHTRGGAFWRNAPGPGPERNVCFLEVL